MVERMDTSENDSADITFDECQIGKGIRPLAQHGTIIVSDGTITLLGSAGDVIDTAPLSETTAKQILITGGQTVSLVLAGRKYNTTPGWGAAGRRLTHALSGVKAPRALVKAVRDHGTS